MKKMQAGEFKAKCLALMDDIQSSGEPIVVTKRGKPVVKVIPYTADSSDIFGFMAGRMTILGDIESPAVPLKDWKIFKK